MQTNTIGTLWWGCVSREGSGSTMTWYFSYMIYAKEWEFVWIYQPGHKPVCQLLSHLATGTGPCPGSGMVGLRLIVHSLISQGKTVPKWGESRWPPLPAWPETWRHPYLPHGTIQSFGRKPWYFLSKAVQQAGDWHEAFAASIPILSTFAEKEKYSVGLKTLPLDGMNWELCISSITGIRRKSDCRLAFTFVASVHFKTVQMLFSSSFLVYWREVLIAWLLNISTLAVRKPPLSWLVSLLFV